MRCLAATLQPHTRVLSNLLVLKSHAVVSLHGPSRALEITAGHKVPSVLEERFMKISEVTGCYEYGVYV